MNRSVVLGWILASLAVLALTGCPSLKKGECKRDSHCDDMATKKGELWACYKEPPEAEMGKCMRAKEAKEAQARYKLKKSGKCEDKDGDGVKAGVACDPPVDCDDNDKTVKPGSAEICDMKDNDCDSLINEGLARCVGTVLGGKQDPVAQFMLTLPAGVEVAPSGEIWAADQHQIYRIAADGKATRYAGSNKPGKEDKKGKFARFDQPRGIAVASDGTAYIADCGNNCIRRIAPDGQVKQYAGLCSKEADNTGLDEVGDRTAARFWCPIDVALDKAGNLLVADMNNSKIKRVSKDGKVEVIAGLGGKEDENGYVVFGNSDGPALKAEFNEPAGIAVGGDGALYITDQKNNCIRVLKDGKVKTLAGVCVGGADKGGHVDGKAAKAQFRVPQGLDVAPDGSVIVADSGNHCIRLIKGGQVTTLTGKAGQQGYYDGPVDESLFNQPVSVSVAKDGSIYIVDHGNYRIRRMVP